MSLSTFGRIVTLPMVAMMCILVTGSLHSVLAATSKGTSDVERYVLDSLQQGGDVDLTPWPEHKRELTGSFVAKLLSRDPPFKKTPTHEMVITGAVITQDLVLMNHEVFYDVSFIACTFNEGVNFTGSHFTRGLTFSGANFKSWADFSRVTIDFGLSMSSTRFSSNNAEFREMRVGRDVNLVDVTFNTTLISFVGTRVGGDFAIDLSKFNFNGLYFDDVRVEGDFSARGCEFSYDPSALKEARFLEGDISAVSFAGAQVTDFLLNEATFEKVSAIDFTGMRADFISLENIRFKTPAALRLERMSFKSLNPVNADQLQFLLSGYNPEFYNDLETTLRTQGYPEEADKIFIAKKRAERRERCKSLLSQCDRGSWALSLFQDGLAGYGKSLQNLLIWSLGFLLFGMLVFRSEKGMRPKDWNTARHYVGRYHPFWYSLDLFLPIIRLGEADVWTPKDNRRWANLYKKVHIVIGSLFVPIGLAAWTGIIR